MPVLLTGLAAGLALAGCGVPSSGVIQAGPAASGIVSPGAKPTTGTVIALYFIHDGDLKPYPRKIDDPADFQSVLDMLFDGPDEQESRSAATKLPRLPGAPDVAIDGENILSVRLPKDAGHPGHLALMQLTCTVAGVARPLTAKPSSGPGGGASVAPPDTRHDSLARTKVKVSGDGWATALSGNSCPDLLPS
ncbi:hypothetical protein AB0D59_27660 [Streptomyces sp. NPDC048417]|uniref:hypothetical protein n=1 Tax=Streptomyces sp. NPDC048417 TaxID=3155387 RepID=UPI00343996A7